jgi:hypothetical protein
MKIGDWPTTPELAGIYRQARALGLESNLAELEAFGFTIVEPDRLAPAKFQRALAEALKSLCDSEAMDHVLLNGFEAPPTAARNLFHVPAKGPVFVEAMMNPVVLTLAKYLCGASLRLYSTVAFVKSEPGQATRLHSDAIGTPPPLPSGGHMCNASWLLTDYTRQNGCFALVAGSHRYCRHPTAAEQPVVLGGSGEEICIPIEAPAGSLLIFHGNMWHGAYPKQDHSLRSHIAFAFCRNYVEPAESFDDIPQAEVERWGDEFAGLLGRGRWQGYGSEGPDYARFARVSRAQSAPGA